MLVRSGDGPGGRIVTRPAKKRRFSRPGCHNNPARDVALYGFNRPLESMTQMGPSEEVGASSSVRSAARIVTLLMALGTLCVSPSAMAQTTQAETAADNRAYEKLLIQRWGRCEMSDADYQAQTQAAERLFFGAYNQGYAGRGTAATAQLLKDIAQHEQALEANPGSYDFSPVCKAVVADTIAFPRSALTARSAPLPPSPAAGDTCTEWNKKDSAASDCRCTTPKSPLPPSPDPSLAHYALKYVDVHTGYCLGATVDGIAFVPKGTSRGMCFAERQHFQSTHDTSTCNAANPDPDTLHIIQFVNTRCPDCTNPTYPVGSTAADGTTSIVENRNLTGNSWYLDSLSSSPYLSPDLYVPVGLSPTGMIVAGTQRIHVISDEPTANLRADHDAPLIKQFYDFVMCNGTVMEAFSWSRQGEQSPQWCGSSTSRTVSSIYGSVRAVAVADIPADARTGICNAGNVNATQAANADVRAIRSQLCGDRP
jgi:hypothetical protein